MAVSSVIKTGTISIECPFVLQNVLAWGVAGAVAYYVYVKPQQMQVEEQKVSVC